MNHGGTQNFTDIKLDRMQQHPSVQAIRIGRTKPYECSYPVIAERPRIPERSKEDGDYSTQKWFGQFWTDGRLAPVEH